MKLFGEGILPAAKQFFCSVCLCAGLTDLDRGKENQRYILKARLDGFRYLPK